MFACLYTVYQILERLLTVGITDPDPIVRRTVLESLDSRFDQFLAQVNARSGHFIRSHICPFVCSRKIFIRCLSLSMTRSFLCFCALPQNVTFVYQVFVIREAAISVIGIHLLFAMFPDKRMF